jgi:hypothetical protein
MQAFSDSFACTLLSCLALLGLNPVARFATALKQPLQLQRNCLGPPTTVAKAPAKEQNQNHDNNQYCHGTHTHSFQPVRYTTRPI